MKVLTCLKFAVQSIKKCTPTPNNSGTPQMRSTLVPIIGQLYDGPVDIQGLAIFQKYASLNVRGVVLSPMQPTDRPKLVQVEYIC